MFRFIHAPLVFCNSEFQNSMFWCWLRYGWGEGYAVTVTLIGESVLCIRSENMWTMMIHCASPNLHHCSFISCCRNALRKGKEPHPQSQWGDYFESCYGGVTLVKAWFILCLQILDYFSFFRNSIITNLNYFSSLVHTYTCFWYYMIFSANIILIYNNLRYYVY